MLNTCLHGSTPAYAGARGEYSSAYHVNTDYHLKHSRAALFRTAYTPGSSWSPPLPDGAHRGLPTLGSRTRWMIAIHLAASSPEIRSTSRVGRAAFIAVARAMVSFGDFRTGRHCTASNTTIGKRAAALTGRSMPYCPTYVSEVRRFIERIGLAKEIRRGRYLTTQERRDAHTTHGGRQIRIASVWSLILPRAWAMKNPNLPCKGKVFKSFVVNKLFKTKARKRARVPLRAQANKKPKPVWGRELYEWVCRYKTLNTWLSDYHPRALCPLIDRLVPWQRWSPEEVRHLIDLDRQKRGLDFPSPTHILRFLAWSLQQIGTELQQPTPAEHRAALREKQASDPYAIQDAKDRAKAAEFRQSPEFADRMAMYRQMRIDAGLATPPRAVRRRTRQ